MIAEKPQRFEGTKAAEKVAENKLEELQKAKVKVTCENSKLCNTFKFKYLGSIFAADGDQRYDVRRRIGMTMSRMGKLTHVFNSKVPSLTFCCTHKSATSICLTRPKPRQLAKALPVVASVNIMIRPWN